MLEDIPTVTSVSGGKTSAYIAANYPADRLVFALVRSDDQNIKFKDPFLRREVEDRLQAPFIATLEDDIIVKTILDLELFIGKKIDWVTGLTFDEVVKTKGGRLPSMLRRFCTYEMKIKPIFDWWAKTFNLMPVYMNIGFRINERQRAFKLLNKCNNYGLQPIKETIEQHKSGRFEGKNKWQNFYWRFPKFPLIDDVIDRADVENYWGNKPVSFALENNCIGCFHKTASKLKNASILHPEKYNWFCEQEKLGKGTWKEYINYEKIKSLNIQPTLFQEGCDSGFCGF